MNTRLNLQALANKWWVFFILGTGLFGAEIFFSSFALRISPDDKAVIYPMIDNSPSSLLWLIPATPYGISIILYGAKNGVGHGVVLGVATFVILNLFLNWIESIKPVNGLDYVGNDDLNHMESRMWHGHAYNLASFYPYEAEALLGNGYVFYECDYLGIFCNAIYRYKPQSLDDAYADYYNPPYILTNDDELQLYIGGEKVFSVPVEKD